MLRWLSKPYPRTVDMTKSYDPRNKDEVVIKE